MNSAIYFTILFLLVAPSQGKGPDCCFIDLFCSSLCVSAVDGSRSTRSLNGQTENTDLLKHIWRLQMNALLTRPSTGNIHGAEPREEWHPKRGTDRMWAPITGSSGGSFFSG